MTQGDKVAENYQLKIKNLKQKAEHLYNKIPLYVRVLPDVKEGQSLQAEVFSLLDEMQKKIEGGSRG